jgi:FkbM family methyltransferase
MDEHLQTIKIRSIYQVKKLPFIARAYRFVYDYRSLSPPSLFQTNRKISSRIVRGLFKSGFGKRQGQFTIQTPQGIRYCDMNINNSQFHAIYFRRFQGGYEPEVCALLDVLVERADIQTFYDIGANWGYFSGYVATHPLFRGKIRAFEPQKTAFADLKKFVRQANLEEFIECHQLALSNTEGLGHIQLPDDFHSGLGQLCPGGSIPIKKLDHLILPPPGLIKIDVESHEYPVIMGAMETLIKHKPYLIFESLPSDHSDSLKILSELFSIQYQCFEINYSALSSALRLTPLTIDSKSTHKRNIFACPCQNSLLIGAKDFM